MTVTAQDVPDIAPRRLREDLGLSRERMARLLEVSAKTITRWEARPEPPANRTARKRLAQLREIVFLGLIVYTPEGFHRFLTTPMPAFDGRTGLQLIENDEGDEVFAALAEDYEGLGYQVPADEFLTPWAGAACRHISDDSPIGVLDFRFAGTGRRNRWNLSGQPTLYLASDHGVLIGEFARHLDRDRALPGQPTAEARRVYDLRVRLDAALDLRDPRLCAELSLRDAPACFLDRALCRAVSGYVRRTTPAQALLVPSIAFLDDPHRQVMVLLLEKLPDDPSLFLPSVTVDGVFGVEPQRPRRGRQVSRE